MNANDTFTVPIKANIRKMAAYSVPQEFHGVKLNQNESASDIPLAIKEEIFRRMKKMQWNRYPRDFPGRLTKNIAAYTNFPAEGIMVGNGSNELIQTLVYSCCDSGDRILTVTPTFSVYHRVAAVMNISPVTVPLKKDFSFDVPAVIKKSHGVKAVILASPNNPTGTSLGMQDIQQIAENIGSLLVMDEAYFEFHGQSAQRFIEIHPNVVVLRTFSKALASAGIRLGYLLGQPRVVDELKKVKLPFSVGLFQQVAGEVIMENSEFLEKTIKSVIRERERVFSALQAMPGIEPVPSRANFILFQSGKWPADEMYCLLGQAGVLVRAYDSPELSSMLRVAIGAPEENTLFLEKIKEIFNFKEIEQ